MAWREIRLIYIGSHSGFSPLLSPFRLVKVVHFQEIDHIHRFSFADIFLSSQYDFILFHTLRNTLVFVLWLLWLWLLAVYSIAVISKSVPVQQIRRISAHK